MIQGIRAAASAPSAPSQIEPAELAASVTLIPWERASIVRNLTSFPMNVRVLGVFFEGMSRVLARAADQAAIAWLQRASGAPDRPVVFRHYPHRDFYKLYYLATRALHPNLPFPTALRYIARDFFPMFRGSVLGRTMNAFMGVEPRTVLPLLSRAYNLSVAGNEHVSELVGERRVLWRCRVESVEWYEETFGGIIEGTAPPGMKPTDIKVTTVARSTQGRFHEYRFEITW
jgi:uncharacterized protein (TIGR02265 family)